MAKKNAVDQSEALSFQRRAEEIEADKDRKRLEREAKKQAKLKKLLAERRERMVAPVLLILTIVISLLVMAMAG